MRSASSLALLMTSALRASSRTASRLCLMRAAASMKSSRWRSRRTMDRSSASILARTSAMVETELGSAMVSMVTTHPPGTGFHPHHHGPHRENPHDAEEGVKDNLKNDVKARQGREKPRGDQAIKGQPAYNKEDTHQFTFALGHG